MKKNSKDSGFSGSRVGDQETPISNASRVASEAEIGFVYRELAEEHVALRAGSTSAARQALSENIWSKIETAQSLNATAQGPLPLHVAARSTPRRSSRMWVAAALCAAAIGVGMLIPQSWEGLLGRGTDQARVSFEVDGTTIGPDVAGRGHLIASESIPVGVRLSDRSQINLQPHTTIRLAALNDGVVIARVSQGTLDVDVIHQEHTDYQFFAGPYLVKVIGTAFRLSYQPESHVFDLKMRAGTVEVVEPDGNVRRVSGDQSLHLKSGGTTEVSGALGDGAVEPSLPSGRDGSAEAADALSVTSPSLRGTPSPQTKSMPDFHALASQGNFAEIVRIAQAQGLADLLVKAPADQLQELAQAARYSGHFDLAERVWQKMSARFGTGLAGQNAVFFLGRLAEQRGQYSSALTRYESYLRTSPQGVYAQEAWGRKLQLSEKSRGQEATRQVAEQYLQRFPRGPYAKTARNLVDGQD